MPTSHLILCRPLLLLPPIPPSIRVFSNESAFRMRWPKYWSYSFSISPSNEHPGVISFRMDWLDLLAVQGTLKSLLQHQKTLKTRSPFIIQIWQNLTQTVLRLFKVFFFLIPFCVNIYIIWCRVTNMLDFRLLCQTPLELFHHIQYTHHTTFLKSPKFWILKHI